MFKNTLILFFVIFLFFACSKKNKEEVLVKPSQEELITEIYKEGVENLKRGDKIVTTGGIVGSVERIIDNEKVEVEIADNVKVEVVRTTGIQALLTTQEVKK